MNGGDKVEMSSTNPAANMCRVRAFCPEPGTPIKQVEKESKRLDCAGTDLFYFLAQNTELVPDEGEVLFFLEGMQERNGRKFAPCAKKKQTGWEFVHREPIPSKWSAGHVALYLTSR
jgi:hypothetical protein